MKNNTQNKILYLLEQDLINNSDRILTEFSLSDIKSKMDPSKIKDSIVKAGNKKINDLNKLQKKHEKILKDNNYKVDEFKSIIKKSFNKYSPTLIDGIKKLDKNLVTVSISNFKQDASTQIKKRGLFEFDKNTPVNILRSFIMVYAIVIINTMIFGILFSIFGPILSMLILAVIVAPLVEEFGKFIAIKSNMGSEFLLTFNIVEFLLYFNRMAAMGIPTATIIIIRLFPVLMHYATASVQSDYRERGKAGIGYMIGVIMHALWNLMASKDLIKQL